MTSILHPLVIVTIFNAILCAIIFILGFWGYRNSKEFALLAIGIAFGLFGASHIFTLLNIGKQLETLTIVIRVLAYLLVVFALNRLVFSSRRGQTSQ